MNDHSHPVLEAVMRILAVIATWALSIKLADVQTLVAIASGLGVIVYTWMQAYVLWRDRIRKPPPEPPVERAN